MLARTRAVLTSATFALVSARHEVATIEASPIADGETRTIKLTLPLRDAETGKLMREEPTPEFPKGKVMRETVEREVAVSRSSQYRKAVKNRRNAARRVMMAERKFSRIALAMSPEKVREALAAV